MSFERRGETVIAAHDLEELKLVFRVLHRQLADVPELMDTHFLTELQRFLLAAAGSDGVDVADHTAWDRWLGGAAGDACRIRDSNRARS
ncbi:MAG: hypothetical protein L6Q92_02340 [Phycisphaerae bacterium]|nr:hypothetical protein [Phycisphaerae bacterium]